MRNKQNPQILARGIQIVCLAFLILLGACEKDNNSSTTPFEINNNNLNVTVPAQGSSHTYTIKSSGAWTIEPMRNEEWISIEPLQGNGDGTITVTIAQNTFTEKRALLLTYLIDGKRKNEYFTIEQEGYMADTDNQQYISFNGNPEILNIDEAGGTTNHILRATGPWKIVLENNEDWISVNPMEGTGDTPITLTVQRNSSNPRTANILFYLNENLRDNKLSIQQESSDIILFEDFNWLMYGNTIFNSTTGETRIANWTPEETARGWTSTINPVTGGGNYASTYARPGFIKLGRTDFGGDLISPALRQIEGTKDIRVSFKSVVYRAGNNGAVDHNYLQVGVTGPGTVSQSDFYINNIPDYINDPQCTEVWKNPEATQTFTITGATAETKVWFLAGAFDIRAATGWPRNLNRIFIDDILISVVK